VFVACRTAIKLVVEAVTITSGTKPISCAA
jgi:hypothetical protein